MKQEGKHAKKTKYKYITLDLKLLPFDRGVMQTKILTDQFMLTQEQCNEINARNVTNDERSALEVYEFMTTKPNKYFLYVSEASKQASTWTGEKLGDVTFGHQYRDNFGGTRVSIKVTGINGVKYSGTYFKSAGDYARIKALKK